MTYLRICSSGALFIVAYNRWAAFFGGWETPGCPVTVTIACVCNIAGDLLLVGGFGLGVRARPIATVLAQAVSVVLSLLIIRRRSLPFIMKREDIQFDKTVIGRIVKLGSPVALQDLLVNISFLVIIAIANHMGTIPSAGRWRGGKAVRLCDDGALCLRAVHDGFCCTECGCQPGRPGAEGSAVWSALLAGGGACDVLGHLFPRRCFDGNLCQGHGGDRGGGGIPEGLCHRLPADGHPVLLRGLLSTAAGRPFSSWPRA